jgi:hypothetical protein
MNNNGDFTCSVCGLPFQTRDELLAHKQTPHSTPAESAEGVDKAGMFQCDQPECGRWFTTKSGLNHHKSTTHKLPSNQKKLAKTTKPIEERKPLPIKMEPKVREPLPIVKDVQGRAGNDAMKITGKVLVKYCPACQTVWDMDYNASHCPDCGDGLQTPAKRKSIRVTHEGH